MNPRDLCHCPSSSDWRRHVFNMFLLPLVEFRAQALSKPGSLHALGILSRSEICGRQGFEEPCRSWYLELLLCHKHIRNNLNGGLANLSSTALSIATSTCAVWVTGLRKLQLWLHGVAQSQAARWAQALSLSGESLRASAAKGELWKGSRWAKSRVCSGAVGDILEGLDSGVLGCNPCEVAPCRPSIARRQHLSFF